MDSLPGGSIRAMTASLIQGYRREYQTSCRGRLALI